MGIVTINIPSQLPVLTGNSLLYLRVNVAENGIEWAATAGGGITIGTTAIASGTVNRILFEGAGNVVQQDSTFVWNNTDKRLILGTEALADANTRLVITGSGTGSSTTTFGLKVHNSTGTNNALIVRDDGRVGIGTNNPQQLVHVVGGNIRIQFADSGGNALAGQLQFGNTGNVFINATATGGGSSGAFSIGTMNSNIDGSFFQLRVSNNFGLNIYPRRTFDGLGLRAGLVAQGNFTGGAGNITGIDFVVNTPGNVVGTWSEPAFRFYTAYRVGVADDFYERFSINNVATVRSTGSINVAEIKGVRSIWGITDNTSITPDNSAILELQSNSRGFLPPRNADPATNIATPAEGLIAFDTTDKKLQVFDGTNWIDLH
jgi:hypothetical protein